MDEKLKGAIEVTVSNLLYYDRKGDEDLPRDEIERMISDNETSIEEIIEQFSMELRKGLQHMDNK